ncbi:MAG: glycosyltransferase family 2 protein [Lautropia sp.]
MPRLLAADPPLDPATLSILDGAFDGERAGATVGSPSPAERMPAADARASRRAEVARLRRDRTPTVSCVVPCCNEAENLAVLLPSIVEVLQRCASRWEIVLVDDGSHDATPLLATRWVLQPGVRYIQLSRNFGKEAALSAGLKAADGEVVVMLDADLQHPPALIARFVELWREGADMVYARREDRRDEAPLKRFGARLFYRLVNTAARFEVPAGAGDFRLMDRSVVDALLALPERNRFMKGLYGWVGFDAVAVPFRPQGRAHGRSNFRALRLLGLSLDGLTAFTSWPLRVVSLAGIVLALLSIAYACVLVVSYFAYGNPVDGWTTIVVSLMLFAGIQLMSIGIVGEYVVRIFEEVKARPLYVVRREAGHGLDAPGG